MANRTRNNGIYLMLSDDELEILNKKYELSGCKTLRQFVMKCILEKDIFVLDMKVFKEMSTNIGRITGSINQIAKRVNSTGIIYKEDISDKKKEIEQFSKELWQIHSLLLNKTSGGDQFLWLLQKYIP